MTQTLEPPKNLNFTILTALFVGGLNGHSQYVCILCTIYTAVFGCVRMHCVVRFVYASVPMHCVCVCILVQGVVSSSSVCTCIGIHSHIKYCVLACSDHFYACIVPLAVCIFVSSLAIHVIACVLLSLAC